MKARAGMVGCTVPLAIVIMSGMVMGSGILPIPQWMLLTASGAMAVLLTLPGIVLGRRRLVFGALSVLAMIGTLVSAAVIFGHFQARGFELAKDYGRKVAQALEATQAATGAWPENLDQLPEKAKPQITLPTPYLSFCEAGVCRKVAGYFIEYRLDETTPHLTVSRRDVSAQWNWSLRRFEERR